MKKDKPQKLTIINGIIIFSDEMNEEEIIPRTFEYPKHYREYCRREKRDTDGFIGSQYIIDHNGTINQKDIEEQIQYKPIIFTNENNDKIYSHLIRLDHHYSMLLFSTKFVSLSIELNIINNEN